MNVKEALAFCKANGIKVGTTKRTPKNEDGIIRTTGNSYNFEVVVGSLLVYRYSGGEACWRISVDGKPYADAKGNEFRNYKAGAIYKAAQLQLP